VPGACPDDFRGVACSWHSSHSIPHASESYWPVTPPARPVPENCLLICQEPRSCGSWPEDDPQGIDNQSRVLSRRGEYVRSSLPWPLIRRRPCRCPIQKTPILPPSSSPESPDIQQMRLRYTAMFAPKAGRHPLALALHRAAGQSAPDRAVRYRAAAEAGRIPGMRASNPFGRTSGMHPEWQGCTGIQWKGLG
ncbi:MAG: hypothetical protein RLZZ165_607, partial [Bacteroidota bacterium]